jgi:hypothetical protein
VEEEMTSDDILNELADIVLTPKERELFEIDPSLLVLAVSHLKQNEAFYRQAVEEQLRGKGYDV